MLLHKLIAKQERMRLSDKQFAVLLGVPRSTWQATRTGKILLPIRAARGAQRVFPDLAIEVLSFLLSDASALAAQDSTHASALVTVTS